jgi:dUTP pyrophosphatase
MTHYTNSIEYRKADDNIEYTYEEFEDYFGDEADAKWNIAGEKGIKIKFDQNKVKYKLYLYIDEDDSVLKEKYKTAVNKWNIMMMSSKYPDAGFDLFTPLSQKSILINKINKVDFKVKTAMYKNDKPVSFTMHPRSSIYKTPFRLTNSTGIIDSGYRGNLGSAFDILTKEGIDNDLYEEKDYDRYIQVCAPSLKRFIVEIVENEELLGMNTERGSGGFGSTGR